MPGSGVLVFRLTSYFVRPGRGFCQCFSTQKFPDGGGGLRTQVVGSDPADGTMTGDAPGDQYDGRHEQGAKEKELSFFHNLGWSRKNRPSAPIFHKFPSACAAPCRNPGPCF